MKDQVQSTSDAVISVQRELASQKTALNDLDTKVETRLNRCSNDIGEIKQDLLNKERMINDLKAMVTGFQNGIPAQMESAVDSKLSSFVQDSYEKLMIEKCKQAKARILFFNIPHTGEGAFNKIRNAVNGLQVSRSVSKQLENMKVQLLPATQKNDNRNTRNVCIDFTSENAKIAVFEECRRGNLPPGVRMADDYPIEYRKRQMMMDEALFIIRRVYIVRTRLSLSGMELQGKIRWTDTDWLVQFWFRPKDASIRMAYGSGPAKPLGGLGNDEGIIPRNALLELHRTIICDFDDTSGLKLEEAQAILIGDGFQARFQQVLGFSLERVRCGVDCFSLIFENRQQTEKSYRYFLDNPTVKPFQHCTFLRLPNLTPLM